MILRTLAIINEIKLIFSSKNNSVITSIYYDWFDAVIDF